MKPSPLLPPARGITLASGCALCLAAIPAAAQTATPLLPEITVSATRSERDSFDVPAAVDRVDARAIRESGPQVNLSEALGSVPGITVQNRQNYAQDLQISSRGFGARASFGVRGLRLLADGIPASMPDGQGQAATFSLGSADRIEVLRGPFAALYGNAAGGVVQVFTADAPPQPTLMSGLSLGSYDTRKYSLQYGDTRGPVGLVVDASRFETDGYRDHSATRRDHVNAKLKINGGSRGTLTLVFNALDQPETRDPLGLDAASLAANRRQAVAAATTFNTRKSVSQTQAGAVYETALGAATLLHARLYIGDRQVTQHLAIPLAAQNLATASGGVVDLDRGFGGAGLRLTHEFDIGTPLTASIGVDYERMEERRRGFINNFGVAGPLKRDEDNTVTGTDFYTQIEWRPLPRLNLLAGLRRSRVAFRSEDFFVQGSNPDDSGSISYSRTTPGAGISYALLPAAGVYANIGRGFETPTFAELANRAGGINGLNFALQPATSLHREIGLKTRFGAMRANFALFRIDVKDEIVVNSSSGGRTDFKNAARTRREGAELSARTNLPRGFETLFAWTLLNARFTETFSSGTPAITVPAGNKLPGVPDNTLYAELVWRDAGSGFHAGVEARHAAKLRVNDQNSAAAPGWTVWNLRAGFTQRGKGWRFSEFIRLENAFDRDYIGSVIVADGNGRFFEPAPGRNLIAGVTAQVEF